MRRFVIPEKVNGGERRLLMKSIIDGADQYQTAIMKYYETGVKRAVSTMGGIVLWKAATTSQRLRIFR